MKLNHNQVERVFLETIVPEYPEVERTEESDLEYREMINELYIESLSRKEKRKIKNPKFKFSNEIKKKLNGR